MSKSLLITGGAASGKSRWAATYFSACDYVLYLKAGGEIDADTLRRIRYACNQNGVEWDIVSSDKIDLYDQVTDHKFVIFDSISSYAHVVLNDMCPGEEAPEDSLKKAIEKRIVDGIVAVREKVEENGGSMIAITLETGFSATPENKRQATFREIVGTVNQRIANTSEEVYFSASGIQFKIK